MFRNSIAKFTLKFKDLFGPRVQEDLTLRGKGAGAQGESLENPAPLPLSALALESSEVRVILVGRPW